MKNKMMQTLIGVIVCVLSLQTIYITRAHAEDNFEQTTIEDTSSVYSNEFIESDWDIDKSTDGIWLLNNYVGPQNRDVYIPAYVGDTKIIIYSMNRLKNKGIKTVKLEAKGPESNPSQIEKVGLRDHGLGGAFTFDSTITHMDLNDLDLTDVTSINATFQRMENLEVLEISKWDTQYFTNFGAAFEGSKKLRVLDVSAWDTRNVFTFYMMFSDLQSLDVLDISNWRLDKAIELGYMFSGSNFKYLNISGWNPPLGSSVSGLFNNTNLSKLVLGSGTTKLQGTLLPESKNGDGSIQEWYLENDTFSFASSAKLMSDYNGSKPGVYYRKDRVFQLSYDSGVGVGDVPKSGKGYIERELATVSFQPLPTKLGHEFSGWLDEDSGILYTEQNPQLIFPKRNVKLVAQFNKKSYNVTYSAGEGTGNVPANQSILYDTTYSLDFSELPTKEGNKFIGWKNVDTGIVYDEVESFLMPPKDVSYVAVYTPLDYSLHFIYRDTTDSHQVLFGDPVDMSIVPTDVDIEGHTFIGWKDIDTGEIYNDIETQFIMPSRVVNLIAQYQVNKYEILFSYGGKEVSALVDYGKYIDTSFVPKPTDVEGHKFIGWMDVATQKLYSDLTSEFKVPARSVHMEAKYQVLDYPVTFTTDDQTYVYDIEYGTTIDQSQIPPVSNIEGYAFIGWKDMDTEIIYQDLTSYIIPARAVNFYPVYDVNTYQIQLDVNGEITLIQGDYGSSLDISQLPTIIDKEGHTFVGWKDVDTDEFYTDLSTFTIPSRNVNLSAEYKVNTYQISFDIDGDITVIRADYGTHINESDLPTIPNKEGYTFVGWKDIDTNEIYTDLSTFTVSSKDTKLTAIYQINQYQITFDIDGDITVIPVDHGSHINAKDIPVVPNKEGYKFVGWRIDSRTRSIQYFDVEKDVVTSDMVLLAEYKKKGDTTTPEVVKPKDDKIDNQTPSTGVNQSILALSVMLMTSLFLLIFVLYKKRTMKKR